MDDAHIKDVYKTVGYSQFGEDAILSWLLNGRKNGFYVDVGCHHPFRFSNTALLHMLHSWSGINIDVDHSAIDLFRTFRPNDINLCIGVGEAESTLEVTIFQEGALNTFDAQAASNPAWAHMVKEKRLVEILPLAAILYEQMPAGKHIDFLNVDAEGLDLDVLKGNDWNKFRPEIIAVEVHGFDICKPDDHATYRFLREKSYRIVSHAAATSFYVGV